MRITPTRFWLTSGEGESDLSELLAIDAALLSAGIGYQNHIVVSSIPPSEEIVPKVDSEKGITTVPLQNKWEMVPFSSLLHVVRSMKTGIKGETLASCIALVKIKTNDRESNEGCLLAYEISGSNLRKIEELALLGVKGMAEQRNATIDHSWGDNGFKKVSSSIKVKKNYGCSASFVVFDPFTYTST
ncbi:MAG: pyruvoyl-dependent arginine decarboxylase [Candidatus Heimdallarchaeaceae archaeon]